MTRIEEIEAREAKATKGPWAAADWQEDDGPNKTTIEALGEPDHHWPGGFSKMRVADTGEGDNPEADADFIAHAREDIPCLLAEVKRMREALVTARGQIVGFSIKEIGSEAAVKNVKYIDDLLKGTQS